ncbi:hypothetical protein CHISP_3432 [Chitinispirillum alkaliphilum]|nr:hypothetical protein CHISP_3432 [Chitinispirillum alkaliphilum]
MRDLTLTILQYDIGRTSHPKTKNAQSQNEEEKPKFVTGVESDENEEPEKPEPEVRLISAQWKEGPEGFRYNKKCFLEVKAEYLRETIRAKIRGKLFGVYNGKEEDLNQEIVGEIGNDGIATMVIKHLWYINDDHYADHKKSPNLQCQYIVKSISHSRGENEIDSPALELPQIIDNIIHIRLPINPDDEKHQNDKYRLFSTDESRTYDRILTVKDDKIPCNDYLDLKYDELDPSLSYTLEIDHGEGGRKYYGFEKIRYEDLKNGL